jgi:hypothetical protein
VNITSKMASSRRMMITVLITFNFLSKIKKRITKSCYPFEKVQ